MIAVDEAYLGVLERVWQGGYDQEDRTSVGCSRQIFGEALKFKTYGRYVPFPQCRTFGPKTSFLEWKWMMKGCTDSTWLEDRGVNIWTGNTTREFLDGRGLQHLPVGDVGKSYGYQLRNFGGVDQLEKVFNSLKHGPEGRRHIISLWNPAELAEAPLEPCAFLYSFVCINGVLNLHQHMRSADVVYGVPYNMAFSSYWLHTFAKALGLVAGEYWLTIDNAHIYKNQFDIACEMLQSKGFEYKNTPELVINKDLNSLDDILSLEYDDLTIKNFTKGPKIGSAEMAV